MRRMALVVVALLGVVAGCSSEDGSASSASTGPCAERAGTYRWSFDERDGDCGAFNEQIVMVANGADEVDPGECQGTITPSSNNCRLTFDLSCPSSSGVGHTLAQRGTIDWNKDGSRATGTIQLVPKNASGIAMCSSTYDVTLTRI